MIAGPAISWYRLFRIDSVKGRPFLVYAIVISVLEQLVLLLVTLHVLPSVGIHVPLWLLVTLVVVLAVQSVLLTLVNLRALGRRPLFSPAPGTLARTVSKLDPVGYVRVGNELWLAASDGSHIERDEVVVVRQRDRMRLIVSRPDEHLVGP